MATAFQLRVEYPHGPCEDIVIGAETLAQARHSFNADHLDLAPFEWRGAVVFVRSARPAEESGRRDSDNLIQAQVRLRCAEAKRARERADGIAVVEGRTAASETPFPLEA